jgi:aldehyde:ferredoxin oxidoreductase
MVLGSKKIKAVVFHGRQGRPWKASSMKPDRVAALLSKVVPRQDVGGILAEGIRPASPEKGLKPRRSFEFETLAVASVGEKADSVAKCYVFEGRM